MTNGALRRWVAWALAVVSGAGFVVACFLLAGDGGPSTTADWFQTVGILAFVVGFAGVALVLTLRRPDHPIGWLMAGFASMTSLRLACEGLLPVAGEWAEPWLVLAINVLAAQIALLAGIVIVFPDGFPTTRPWRAGLGAVVAAGLLIIVTAPFIPYDLGSVRHAAPLVESAVAGALAAGSMFVIFGVGLVAVIRLVVLLFRGDTIVRHQVRWVAYTVIVTMVVLALDPLFPHRANVLAGLIAGIGIPVALAVAITRYRLYDIDRVVNRTVVYAIVVGLLGAVFVAGAVWLPSLLPFEDNSLAVAASTLAVFFLFNPLRVRVQRLVDQRFHRSRYDAQVVSDQLAGRLRDQVDPDAVAGAWVDVVRGTLAPATVAVWVSEDG